MTTGACFSGRWSQGPFPRGTGGPLRPRRTGGSRRTSYGSLLLLPPAAPPPPLRYPHVPTPGTTSTPLRATSGSGGHTPHALPYGEEHHEASAYDFSPRVKEEALVLLFQMELDVMLQRALHYDAYEEAKAIRRQRDEVDRAGATLQAAKGAASGSSPRGSSVEMMDVTTQGLALRSQLQRAVEEEDYAEAAKIRDELTNLEKAAQMAALRASEFDVQMQPRFRLGQRVWRASRAGRGAYRGTVIGWDARCCETEEWVQSKMMMMMKKKKSNTTTSNNNNDGDRKGTMGTEEGGEREREGEGEGEEPRMILDQYFYHVLVDARDWGEPEEVPTTYVGESELSAPSTSWVQEHPEDGEFRSPFSYAFFLGTDNRGDLIPVEQLRNKYSVERWDVGPIVEADEDDEED